MRTLARFIALCTVLLAVFAAASASAADERNSVTIVFKDGHHQTFSIVQIASIELKGPAVVVYMDGHREKISGDIARIEFEQAAPATTPSRSHFLGKWEVGEGNGSNFYITLEANGDAKKSIGATHGTWTLVDGEAHIAWDDGWHDIIRKVGSKHEKLAFEPGKSFSDPPANVTAARNTELKPI